MPLGVADDLFRATGPGDLPIEQACKFTFVINLKTAKALGNTVPRHCCRSPTR